MGGWGKTHQSIPNLNDNPHRIVIHFKSIDKRRRMTQMKGLNLNTSQNGDAAKLSCYFT